MAFDPASPEYRCWRFHVRYWAIGIGICELIGMIGGLIRFCYDYARHVGRRDHSYNVNAFSFFGIIIGFVSALIAIGLLFVGIFKERHSFLIPHLIVQIIAIVGMGTGIAVCIVVAITAGGYGDNALLSLVCGIMFVLAVLILIEVLVFIVLLRCYRFFRGQRNANRIGGHSELLEMMIERPVRRD